MAKQTSSRSSPTPTKRKRASAAPPAESTDVAAAPTDVPTDGMALRPSTPPPTHEEIAARALEIYHARGSHEGTALSDWLKAESELRVS